MADMERQEPATRLGPDDLAPEKDRFFLLLLVPGLIYLGAYLYSFWQVNAGVTGFIQAPGVPFGGDFINQWSVGRLLMSGDFATIYLPNAFMAFQESFVGQEIGMRLWAYPPHSLLFVWPSAFGGYHLMFVLWSVFGLAVLAAGARAFGFSWKETVILTVSPAALYCVTAGQTGNVAAGLMLLAFARPAGARTIGATALLTIKPQMGFLIPLVWLLDRRWTTILLTAAVTVALVALSVALFGIEAWRDYLGATLPALSELERHGDGSFKYIIPSLFMSLRLLGVDGDVAFLVHLGFAAMVFCALVFALTRMADRRLRTALVLVATSLITPYMHFYDLGILLAGVMIALSASRKPGLDRPLMIGAVVAWVLPIVIVAMGLAGLPLSPLLILAMFVAVCAAGWPAAAKTGAMAADGALAHR